MLTALATMLIQFVLESYIYVFMKCVYMITSYCSALSWRLYPVPQHSSKDQCCHTNKNLRRNKLHTFIAFFSVQRNVFKHFTISVSDETATNNITV